MQTQNDITTQNGQDCGRVPRPHQGAGLAGRVAAHGMDTASPARERIHVAWCPEGGEWDPQHLEALEAAAFERARWWALDELLASDEPVLPERLREFLPDVVAGRLPDEPIDISPVAGP